MHDLFSPHSEKTLPLTVGNTGFLVDRMGEDCHPLQFLRELTQNAIEAVQRTQHPGEIIWDVDWLTYQKEGLYKLSLVDNGDGMTGEEMVQYINKLSSSVSKQSFAGNYGVGAKIAAATRNHEGLIYLSWKDGEGAMIHLWRDPSTGQYGLRQLERPDGTYGHFAKVEDRVKPDLIEDHGTKVILLGNSPEADTMNAPEGAASPSRWIAKYLNTRYFKFPNGITVRAREGWTNPLDDTDRNVLRRLSGQYEYLEKHSEATGKVILSDAAAHWWILKDEPALSNNSGFIESSGHVAALYADELYEMATARRGMARLQQFGVILGHRRVVIYVAPNADGQRRLTTNTARTQLLIDNEELPWPEWAAEFRDKMPPEIEELIQEVAAGSSSSDHSSSIRDRLKQIMDLFKVTRYKSTPLGSKEIDPESLVRGGKPQQNGGSTTRRSTSRTGRKGGRAGGAYSSYLKSNGSPGEEVTPDPFPEVVWISVKDGTREPDDLEDRAARYLAGQNKLLVNKDFRGFTDLVDRWHKEFGSKPAIRDIVEDSVLNWFEQTLVETVLGVQALQNAPEWSVDDIDNALSEEALTAAVMPRYHVNFAAKRELSSKLGKIQA